MLCQSDRARPLRATAREDTQRTADSATAEVPSRNRVKAVKVRKTPGKHCAVQESWLCDGEGALDELHHSRACKPREEGLGGEGARPGIA